MALACFLPTIRALWSAGYAAPVNAGGMDFANAVRYSIREAPWLWGLVVVTGIVFAALTWRGRRAVTWQVAAALLVGPSCCCRSPRSSG